MYMYVICACIFHLPYFVSPSHPPSIPPLPPSSLSLWQARVLYDFEGDTENGELVIKEGDEVVILNQVHVTMVTDQDAYMYVHPSYACTCTLYMYMYTCTCTCTCIHVQHSVLYIHLHNVHVYMSMLPSHCRLQVEVCIHVHVHVHVYTCACMYMYMYIYFGVLFFLSSLPSS